jgi:hypothetical protein
MGLRIFGGAIATLLITYSIIRYKRARLRRGELLAILMVGLGLWVAAIAPDLFDPLLSALGFQRGNDRRIIGLLVISNLFTLALVFRGFTRDDQLSDELGELVDYIAFRRLEDEGQSLNGRTIRDSCAVVIPAYNEADNLPSVLGEMPREVCGLHVAPIVIADGCTDATEAAARNLGAVVVRRDLRRGSGAAVRLGYKAARNYGAKVVVTLDADGQHDPKEMELLVKPLLSGGADMVQGSRILGSFEMDSKIRKYGVSLFARLLTTLSRTRITDPSTGYRAMTIDMLRRLDLRQDQFYVSELLLDSARKGFSVVEVPITMRARSSGATKKPTTLRYAWGFSKAIMRTWLR